jgi:hypothetical protein
MALRYLFDEHLRGDLWRAVGTYNAQAADPLDVLLVGDPPGEATFEATIGERS